MVLWPGCGGGLAYAITEARWTEVGSGHEQSFCSCEKWGGLRGLNPHLRSHNPMPPEMDASRLLGGPVPDIIEAAVAAVALELLVGSLAGSSQRNDPSGAAVAMRFTHEMGESRDLSRRNIRSGVLDGTDSIPRPGNEHQTRSARRPGGRYDSRDLRAEVAEPADAADLKSAGREPMGVRISPSVPRMALNWRLSLLG